MENNEYLDQIKDDISNNRIALPVLPEIALNIRTLLYSEAVTASKIADLIRREPAIAARIIKVANSAAQRGGKPISDLTQAVVRLGNSLVGTLVTGMSLVPIFQAKHPNVQCRLRLEWEHSLHVGAIAYVLAKSIRYTEKESSLLAGLMHDIGKLPILSRLGQIPSLATDRDLIQELVDEHHVEVGLLLLESWHLPDKILAATRHHHHYEPGVGSTDLLDDIIRVADHQSYRLRSDQQQPISGPTYSAAKLNYDFEQGLSDQQTQEIGRMMIALN